MNCTSCGGGLEFAGGGAHARCMRCLTLFQVQGGALTPMVVQAPGGGNDPQFNAIFAQQLGFGPPPQQGAGGYGAPQGAGGYGAPQGPGGYGAPQGQGGYGAPAPPAGGFGAPPQGPDFEVRINGMTPENYAKKKVSGMVWSLIIGGAILGVIVLVFVGIGVFVYTQVPDGSGSGAGPKTAAVGAWDGTSTFECGSNDAVKLSGVKASAGVKASGNCKLDLVGVTLDAPVGIEASANARVTMTGGAVSGSENSVVASGNAQVTLTGAKVTGPVKKSGGAKVIGAK